MSMGMLGLRQPGRMCALANFESGEPGLWSPADLDVILGSYGVSLDPARTP